MCQTLLVSEPQHWAEYFSRWSHWCFTSACAVSTVILRLQGGSDRFRNPVRLFSTEPNLTMILTYARNSVHLSPKPGFFFLYPFESGSQDLVLARQVLYHLNHVFSTHFFFFFFSFNCVGGTLWHLQKFLYQVYHSWIHPSFSFNPPFPLFLDL
jgi:hypothetical protein